MIRVTAVAGNYDSRVRYCRLYCCADALPTRVFTQPGSEAAVTRNLQMVCCLGQSGPHRYECPLYLESGRISAWCRTSLPSQARTRRKPPDQEIFQSTVSSKTFRGKYFSSHRPRHSKCFGRRLRRSVMVASVISAAVSWGCARQSSWGSEPSWIPPSLIFTGFFAKRPFLPCIQDTANIPSP